MSRKFVHSLKVETNKRFPEHDMGILKALNKILNPSHLPLQRNDILEYGQQHLQTVLEAFPTLDDQRTQNDFLHFKFLLNNNRDKSLQAMCTALINNHKEQFPDFAELASISLVIPLTSVPCERAFSIQNAVMNTKRNRMGTAHLNNKMLVMSEIRQYPSDFSDLVCGATDIFQQAAKRKKVGRIKTYLISVLLRESCISM